MRGGSGGSSGEGGLGLGRRGRPRAAASCRQPWKKSGTLPERLMPPRARSSCADVVTGAALAQQGKAAWTLEKRDTPKNTKTSEQTQQTQTLPKFNKNTKTQKSIFVSPPPLGRWPAVAMAGRGLFAAAGTQTKELRA